jgi:chorismate lyase
MNILTCISFSRLAVLQVILLSDGSVTRHLQLMTGLPVSVECLEMRRLDDHETLPSSCNGNGYNSDGNGVSFNFNNNFPPAISLLDGPLVQRQVLLHLPEPLNRAFVYAASWWNADTVEEYLK